MPRIAVLGATGPVGRRTAAALRAAGHDLVLVGRDGDRLREVAADLEPVERTTADPPVTGTETRSLPSGTPDALRAAIAGVDLVVSALPATAGAADRALDAAVAHGVPVVATSDDAAHLRRAYDEVEAAARAAGTCVVPGVGWRTATGDLLAAVAAERVLAPRAVHAAAVVPDGRGVLASATPGQRREAAAALDRPVPAVRRGELVEELVGEERRLAWFPRPFGPHHAAGVGGLEPFSVPRHLPTAATVRSYLAVSSLRAELLQATGSLARWGPVRRRLAARLERHADRWRPTAWRWAVVVEVEGDDGLARGWINGHDTLEATALLVAAVADVVLRGDAPAGVVPPALVGRPQDLLDRIAGASSIRWSVSRPRGPSS